jgi:hypothetical protein
MKGLIGLPFLLALLLFASADNATIRAVFIRDGQIYVTESGSTRKVTMSAERKRLPVWSREGTLIAYIQDTATLAELGQVEIISAMGAHKRSVPIRTDPRTAVGMRSAESLEWLSDTRIAVSGTLNPSTVETVVLDISTNTEVDDIYDDAGGAVFSPDGQHVAFVTGSPHFTPEEDRRPELRVDGKRIFPSPGSHVVLLTRPIWSESSRKLGIVAKNFDNGKMSAFTWDNDGHSSQIELSATYTSAIQAFWNEGLFFVRTGDTTHSFSSIREVPIISQEMAVSYQLAGLKLQLAKAAAIEKEGGREVDLWCSDCPISVLPRGEGPQVRNTER